MDTFEDLVGTDEITIKALQQWYARDIAKYGVVVLAYLHGKRVKVLEYIVSLFSLKVKLGQKMMTVQSADTKTDLAIMQHKTEVLLQSAISNFNINLQEIQRIADEFGEEIVQTINEMFSF